MTRTRPALAAQAVTSAALLVFLFRSFDWGAFAALFTRLPPWLYLAGLGITTGGQVLYAYKWHVAVRALGITTPFRRVLGSYYVGVFFNNFLPSTIGGDWVKVYYLGRNAGYVESGASVFVDRFLGAMFLILFAAALLWAPGSPDGSWRIARGVLTAGGLSLAGLTALALLVPEGRAASRLTGRPGLTGRLAGVLSMFAGHVRVALRHPGTIGVAAAAVLVYFLALAAFYEWFLSAVAAVDAPYHLVLAAAAAVSALSMIPVAVNGLGLREQLHVTMLGALGVPREAAFAVSMVLVSHLLLNSLAGLALWLAHPRQVER